MQAESERLRNSLLSAVVARPAHPVDRAGRTRGLAGRRPAPAAAAQAEAASGIRDEALRLCRMVNNLLDMARLQAERVVLRKEWQPLEDVVATSVSAVEAGLPEGQRVRDRPARRPAAG